MKRLVILVVVGVAVWIAWKRGPNVFERLPQHVVVVKNNGVSEINRLRVTVAGQTFVRETLENEVEVLGRDLAPFKRVKKLIVRRDDLPKTSTGKIRRDSLDAEQ